MGWEAYAGRTTSRATSGTAGRAAGRAASRASAAVGHGLRGGTAAAPALDGDDLDVVGAESHALSGPGVEVIGHCDGAAHAGRVTDRDVLPEGVQPGASNGGLVDLLVLPDGVGAIIGRHGAHVGAADGDADVLLHDVVLDQRVGGPAVNAETAEAAAHAVGARVGDGPELDWEVSNMQL